MLVVQDVDLTPNPQALKFIVNQKLLNYETRSFQNKEEAEIDPLAKGLFEMNGVVSVFYMDKFITIEKAPEAAWSDIQKELVGFLARFDKTQIPGEKDAPTLNNEEETELLKLINQILDQRVRPALAGDGGGLEVIGLNGFQLAIKYQGACGSCPSSIRGTLVAIENLLQREVNPAIEVVPA